MAREGLYFGGHFGRFEEGRMFPIIAASYLDIGRSHEDIGAVIRTLNDLTVPIEDLMKYGEVLINEDGSAKISYFESKTLRGQIILRTWDGEQAFLPNGIPYIGETTRIDLNFDGNNLTSLVRAMEGKQIRPNSHRSNPDGYADLVRRFSDAALQKIQGNPNQQY